MNRFETTISAHAAQTVPERDRDEFVRAWLDAFADQPLATQGRWERSQRETAEQVSALRVKLVTEVDPTAKGVICARLRQLQNAAPVPDDVIAKEKPAWRVAMENGAFTKAGRARASGIRIRGVRPEKRLTS